MPLNLANADCRVVAGAVTNGVASMTGRNAAAQRQLLDGTHEIKDFDRSQLISKLRRPGRNDPFLRKGSG